RHVEKLHRSGLHHAAAAEQASRTHEQDDDGDQVDDDLIDAGEDRLDFGHRCEALQDAEQEAGGDRPRQRTHAADNDDDDAQHQEVHAERVARWHQRRVHDTGHAGDDRGQAEHDGETAADVDAEQPDRLAIGHTGADDHAESGEAQEGEDRPDDDDREQQVGQPPQRVGEHVRIHADQHPDIGGAAQGAGHWLRYRIGAEKRLHDFLQHDSEAEGDQDLLRVRTLVEMLDDPAFHGDADHQHHRNGEQDAERDGVVDEEAAPVTEPGLRQRRTNLDRCAPGRQLRLVEGDGFHGDEPTEGDGAEGTQHEQGAV